jgi:hypothetical protein
MHSQTLPAGSGVKPNGKPLAKAEACDVVLLPRIAGARERPIAACWVLCVARLTTAIHHFIVIDNDIIIRMLQNIVARQYITEKLHCVSKSVEFVGRVDSCLQLIRSAPSSLNEYFRLHGDFRV